MAKYCWSLALKSMAHNNIAHDIVGKKQSIRYYFAFSQKPRKLYGNNVAEIIVIRHSVWSALVYYVIEMHLAIGVVYSLLVD